MEKIEESETLSTLLASGKIKRVGYLTRGNQGVSENNLTTVVKKASGKIHIYNPKQGNHDEEITGSSVDCILWENSSPPVS